jgi:CBS domain containing-hemolysin-like protein
MESPAVLATILVGCLTTSFLMSGMEAGVFALNPVRIRHWMRKGRKRAGVLEDFLRRPERFLWTILVGNAVANFAVIVLVVLFLHRHYSGSPGMAAGLFLLALFVFYVTCDLLPKVLFRAFPNRLCLALVGPFQLMDTVLRPLVAALQRMSGWLRSSASDRPEFGPLSTGRDELRLALRAKNPALSGEEQVMIARVLDLRSMRVGQLGQPLARAVTVEAEATLQAVLQLATEHRLTRIPVWRGTGPGRHIAGIVSLKTLLYQTGLNTERPVVDYIKPALVLSEDLRAEEALRRMRRSGERLAILRGADRRETGVVSMEDMLRFVFGGVTS